MNMIVYDCSYGHLIFEVLDYNALLQLACSDIVDCKIEKLKQILWLREVINFDEENATEACVNVVEGILTKVLHQWFKTVVSEHKFDSTQIFVSNHDLAQDIMEKFPTISCSVPSFILRLIRLIRLNLEEFLLVTTLELNRKNSQMIKTMTKQRLLSNTEVDDMRIIQAVSLLDSLNKELDSHIDQIKKKYCIHFPELDNIITNDIDYCKFITIVGDKRNTCQNAPIIVSTFGIEIERMLMQASSLKTGQPFDYDSESTQSMLESAEIVVETWDYRNQLMNFLKDQMNQTAPNLTIMVGENVGSRLIARVGSLEALSKLSSSDIQLAGAERAMNNARDTNTATPKYGYIFSAPICVKAEPKLRGKLARSLASKIALACRIDAMGQQTSVNIASKYIQELEKKFINKNSNKIHGINEVVDAAKLSMLNTEDRSTLKRMNIDYDESSLINNAYVGYQPSVRGRKVKKN